MGVGALTKTFVEPPQEKIVELPVEIIIEKIIEAQVEKIVEVQSKLRRSSRCLVFPRC